MKVLVIQQKMIGDVLTSTILLEALRTHFREAELHYLINENTSPVVENNPFIDNVLHISTEVQESKRKLWDFGMSLASENYDVVIDVYSKLGSAFITKLSQAPMRVGYEKWYTKLIYTHTYIPKNQTTLNEGLAIENRLLLLQPLIANLQYIPKPKIYLLAEELEAGKQLLIKHKINFELPLFMISILGSSQNKTYPPAYMASLLDYLVENTNGQLLFNFIPSQQKEAYTLYDLCNESTKENCVLEVYGKNIREFLSITAHCDALLGNEGGAINMAKALNIPTFSIYAPWILKEAWNSYEKEGANSSVHLKDFKPKLYEKHPKKYKNLAAEFYSQFTPEWISIKLKEFLIHHKLIA